MRNLYLAFILIMIIGSSCAKRFYAPALYQHDVSYLPKPSSYDTAKSATYLSIGGGFNQAVNLNNSVSFGELTLSEAHTFKSLALSYGVYGLLGGINNSNSDNEKGDANSFDTKNFGAVGGRLSLNFYKAFDNINFRFFGVEASYSKEFGDYSAYRRQISSLPDYIAITRTELMTIGGTSEILWHSARNKSTRHALRGFIGKTLGNFDQVKTDTSPLAPNIPLYLSMSYFAQFDQFFGVAELTKNDISIPGIRIKLGYKF